MIGVPEPDEVTAAWWAATREHRLLVQACSGCGHRQHPPRALCTSCGSTDALGHHEASGTAAVDAVTVVERSPGPDHPAPYALVRVRLAEGVVLLSQVETERPHDVAIGDRLALHWRDLADGRALPVFRPTEETS